jgi:hypothetical protein
MARPQKEGLDYFSLDVNCDDKVKLIEAKFGVEGFGVLIKLWQIIYDNGYYVEWTERELLLYKSRIHADISKVKDIIQECLKWNLFDIGLYERFHILTSRGIQKRYLEAIKRRNEIFLEYSYWLIEFPVSTEKIHVTITHVYADNNAVNADINSKNADSNTQSKVKESKVKESKVKNTKVKNIKENLYDGFSADFKKTFEDYIEMRNKIHKPMTDNAIKLALKKLSELTDTETEKIRILEQSVFHSWQGLFLVKENAAGRTIKKPDYTDPERYKDCPSEADSI